MWLTRGHRHEVAGLREPHRAWDTQRGRFRPLTPTSHHYTGHPKLTALEPPTLLYQVPTHLPGEPLKFLTTCLSSAQGGCDLPPFTLRNTGPRATKLGSTSSCREKSRPSRGPCLAAESTQDRVVSSQSVTISISPRRQATKRGTIYCQAHELVNTASHRSPRIFLISHQATREAFILSSEKTTSLSVSHHPKRNSRTETCL